MKYINNYWAEELPNGVIHLLINCTQKEIYYHAISDNEFIITGTEEESDNWGDSNVILKTESFLPNNKDILYVMSSAKNKEQLSFYWIPYRRLVKREKKLLLNVSVK